MATAATLISGHVPSIHNTRSGLRGLRTSSRQESNDDGAANSPEETSCRILAPSQKRLSTVESQRVAAVMDEGIKRFEIALLIPFLAASASRFSVSLGSELVAMLEEYHMLASDYPKCSAELLKCGLSPKFERSRYHSGTVASTQPVTRAARLRPLNEGGARGDFDNPEAQFSHVQNCLKQCVKSILRAMCRAPSAASIVKSSAKERSKMATSLLDSAMELQRVMNEKLLTSKVEEDRRKVHLSEVLQRQAKADEEIKRLEAELAEAFRLKNDEVSCQGKCGLGTLIK